MPDGRRVSLILCDADGETLGRLPPFTVEDPWWPEVGPVVAGARERFGAEVVVLRLLDVVSDSFNGGDVTYAAELVGELPPGVTPAPEIGDAAEPLRAAWARPGGVRATIAWADDTLESIGRPRVGPTEQIKTWNLSSVLRLPTAADNVWCKSVPPFLTHEGWIIAMVGADDPVLVPRLLASDPTSNTVLLDDVRGEDDWDAPQDRLLAMVGTLVRLQARWIDRVDELLDAGLPDWRGPSIQRLVEELVARSNVRAQLTGDELRRLDALVASLPGRLAALHACGLPATLVHGDFHPGNWRSDGTSLVLLDWGDVGVGHPMFDMSSFEAAVADDAWARVFQVWIDEWSRERPGSDPARAAELIRPVAAFRAAVVYQRFLDNIEPSERRYHESDVRDWLRIALERAAEANGGPEAD
jgi:Phosphotransferase enzyme family